MHRTCVQVSRLFACIPVKIAIVLAKPSQNATQRTTISMYHIKSRTKSEDMKWLFPHGFKAQIYLPVQMYWSCALVYSWILMFLVLISESLPTGQLLRSNLLILIKCFLGYFKRY